jgi:CRISPR-associated endonuclease/helicase Cas3
MLTDTAEVFDRYDLRVDINKPLALNAVAQIVTKEFLEGSAKSCLVILNTIQEALDMHNLIAGESTLSQHRVFHLSTNLRPKDRKRILAEIAHCGNPHILIATQVVEAGVDLSFDVVIRAIAPLDAIVQAAGRCNRHGSGIRGRVIVVVPEGNTAIRIYGTLHISLSSQMLGQIGDAQRWVPEPQVRRAVSDYFSELNKRIQKDTASMVQEAICKLQFAALRGEGNDQHRKAKQIQLIEDSQDRVPHFIETDDSDTEVWDRLASALGIQDVRLRRQRLRLLRNDIGQRIVEVPSRFRFKDTATNGMIIRVPQSAWQQSYDIETGWRRLQ